MIYSLFCSTRDIIGNLIQKSYQREETDNYGFSVFRDVTAEESHSCTHFYFPSPAVAWQYKSCKGFPNN